MNTFSNSQFQGQRQSQKVSFQHIQFLNMLNLSVIELEQYIKSEIEENPALETSDINNEEFDRENEMSNNENEENEIDVDLLYNNSDNEIDYYNFNDDDIDTYEPNIEKPEFEFTAVNINSFQENLKEQLSLRDLSQRQSALCAYIIDTLEDDGYLRRSIEDLADDISFAINLIIEESEIESCLKIIHTLEPIGIGSRNLDEFMMLQLRELARKGVDTSIACSIVAEFLDDVAQKKYNSIIQSLQITPEELNHALKIISHLNPKPVLGINKSEETTRTIIPDFTVKSNDQRGLDIIINCSNISELIINTKYREILNDFENHSNISKAQHSNIQYIKSKVNAAEWFINALKQREESIKKTINAIVKLQYEYLLTGDIQYLRPMTLKDIANRVSLDVSTISRVTSTRYVETDFGIIPLKELFTEGVLTEDGKWISTKVVQEKISEIIDLEDKNNPLSDQKIVEILEENNYKIARRVVAKYREVLGIPNSNFRRD